MDHKETQAKLGSPPHPEESIYSVYSFFLRCKRIYPGLAFVSHDVTVSCKPCIKQRHLESRSVGHVIPFSFYALYLVPGRFHPTHQPWVKLTLFQAWHLVLLGTVTPWRKPCRGWSASVLSKVDVSPCSSTSMTFLRILQWSLTMVTDQDSAVCLF